MSHVVAITITSRKYGISTKGQGSDTITNTEIVALSSSKEITRKFCAQIQEPNQRPVSATLHLLVLDGYSVPVVYYINPIKLCLSIWNKAITTPVPKLSRNRQASRWPSSNINPTKKKKTHSSLYQM